MDDDLDAMTHDELIAENIGTVPITRFAEQAEEQADGGSPENPSTARSPFC